jgi:ERCC4-type nuclease
MKLCIDNRERDRIPKFQIYIDAGKSKTLDGVELDNYGTSDFHTPDNLIGIEYKKDDFLKSMYEGLLDKQVHELKEHFQYPFLFIGYDGFEEMFRENPTANPEAIIGELASIVAREKVMYLFVGDLLVPITVKIIDRFYDGKTPVKVSNYLSMRNKLTKAKPSNDEVKRHIVGDIPRVGHGKAQQLLQRYNNSLRQLGDAPLDELANLQIGQKKLGEKLAIAIKEILK